MKPSLRTRGARTAWLAVGLLLLGLGALVGRSTPAFGDLAEFLGIDTLDRPLWFGLATVVMLLAFLSVLVCLMLELRRRDQRIAALQIRNEALQAGMEQRTGELHGALAQIESFACELDRTIEAERRRVSREVHDQLGQVFTSLQLLMSSARPTEPRTPAPAADAQFARQHTAATVPQHTAHGAHDQAAHLIESQMRSLLAEGIEVARRIALELRPALLDDFGLAAAVSHYAENQARIGAVAITVDIDNDNVLSPTQANQLFRIVQEAVINVQRHADARHISITGFRSDTGYDFEIADDGRGPGPVRAGASGLHNMRQRAHLAGGTFHFGPGCGQGTVVALRLPVAVLFSESAAQPLQEA